MTFRELSGICVTAIVMDAPRLGPKGEPAPRGLKHFAPGARIYIAPTSGYDVGCWERAICAGIHRDDNLLAVVWTDIRRLESATVVMRGSRVARSIRLTASTVSPERSAKSC